MNILVLLRSVRDPAGFTINRRAQKIFINRERFLLNPSDRNALEMALTLAGTAGQVIVVALGGARAQEILAMARATGAHTAIHVAVPENAALDAFGTARALRQVVRHVGGVDLVLLGAEVLDADTAQTGARLAVELDLPLLEDVYAAQALSDGGFALAVSTADGFHWLSAGGPAVATVVRDCNRPRYAPAASIITVYSNPEPGETIELTDLGLDAAELAPLTQVRGESFPPERQMGRLLDGADSLRQLAGALRAR